MKKIKKLAVALCILIILFCLAVIYIACNPELSDQLAVILYGDENNKGLISTQETVQSSEETQESSQELVPESYEPMDKPLTIENSGEPMETSELEKEDPGSHDIVENQRVTVIDVMSEKPSGKVPVYSKPIIEELNTSEELKKKSGYVEISEDTTEIKTDEATKIEEENTSGIDGSNYSFDTEFYPYYGMLDENQQLIYKQIYANANNLTKSFVPCTEIQTKKIKEVFEAVYNDHPELFWVETSYGCKILADGRVVLITMSFNKLADDLEQSKSVFYDKINRIVQSAEEYSDPYEQEKYVHNLLMQMITYDAQATNNQSAYSAVIDNKTVCAGYARAFQLIMQKLGIPCYYCTGYSGENHAWNIIKLYGSYYNVDVTWDDTDPGTYNYFNKTDQEFSTNHIRKGMSEKLPACLGELYNGLETSKPGEEQKEEDSQNKDEVLETILGNYDDLPESLVDYYSACYLNFIMYKSGEFSFNMEVSASDWAFIEDAYEKGNFRAGFLDYSVNRVGAEGCSMKIEAFLLKNGNYRLDHYVNLWK